MHHPIEKYNQIQAERLAGMPDEEREFWARMFRIGNAAYSYHNRLATEPTETDYQEWLEGLPHDGFRNAMKADGFKKAKSVWSFRRYIQEKNDIGMDEFMQQHLSAADYVFHQESGKP